MILAHGTSLAVARRAVAEGLKARGKRKSKWKSFPSISSHVYLTNAYALHYAMNATTNRKEMGIVLVDTSRLNQLNMVADEDIIGQLLMRQEGLELREAQKRAIKNIWTCKANGFGHAESLEAIGNCSHFGDVPAEAIVGVIGAASGAGWYRYFDPTITPLNYRIMGAYYRRQQAILARLPEPNDEDEWGRMRPTSDAERKFILENSWEEFKTVNV